MMEIAHIPIMGFRQNANRITGMERLWRKLRKLTNNTIYISNPLEWDHDWSAFASFLWRNSSQDCVIKCYAYSWGMGNGFVKFAEQLAKRGRQVKCVVSCDGVARTRLLPSWLPANILSMTPWLKLKIPTNVKNVHWFYQRQNRPQGHKIVALNPNTTIHQGIQLPADHPFMDEQPEFQNLAMKVAQET